MPDFPATIPVKDLRRTHEEYDACVQTWTDVRTLFRGGYELERQIARYLRMRPKELAEVYQLRQKNMSYTNLMNNVIGWYDSALWQEPPTIEAEPEEKPGLQDFRAAFERDCTRSGLSLQAFFERLVESMLMYRYGYVLIDMPAGIQNATNLAEQQANRGTDPLLIQYQPASVINWAEDDMGALQWAVVYIREVQQQFAADPLTSDCWYYYDATQVAKYEREVKASELSDPSDAKASLAQGYPRAHALTKLNKMPLYRFSVPDGLWFGNKVKLPLLNHLNLDNALDFGLFQSCLAQLVVKGQYGNNAGGDAASITNSEVGYHQIESDGDMFFLEPQGNSFKIAQDRLDSLEERIYKACYLQDQARTNRSTPTAQSGISKAQDKMPARDALSGIGDVLRPAMELIYGDVLKVRGFADSTVNVRGFDFNDKSISELELLDAASVITVNSPTYERKIAKKVVRIVLPDESADELKAIDSEIDASPTPQEQMIQQQQEMKQQNALKFKASLDKVA